MSTRYSPDDPREWLNRATSNFQLAKQRSPRILLEDLCAEAYECAEKALKAVYVLKGAPAPAARNLDVLIAGLAERGLSTDNLEQHARKLMPYGPGAEYPTAAEPVTEDEYGWAIDASHEILEWARNAVHAVPAYA